MYVLINHTTQLVGENDHRAYPEQESVRRHPVEMERVEVFWCGQVVIRERLPSYNNKDD